MSSILSRPRHRLTAVLPSKRRILVLTDTPRLLCVKEERDRVVVKSVLLFSGSISSAGAGVKPQTVPNGRGRSIARWKPSSSTTGSVSGAGSNSGTGAVDGEQEPVVGETIRTIETKGEKSFVVQTVSRNLVMFNWLLNNGRQLSKSYTYVAENSEEAVRWVQQIKAAVQQVQRRRSSRLSTRPTVGQ